MRPVVTNEEARDVRIVPDWEKEHIVIAWPTVRPAYTASGQTLLPFFRRLTRILDQAAAKTTVLVPSEIDRSTVSQCLSARGSVQIRYLPGLSDLWLRDCAPWLVETNEVRSLWQPEFDPPYLSVEPHLKSNRAVLESYFRANLSYFSCSHLTTQLDWKWDGGNATTNGAGWIVATEALLHANKQKHLRKVCESLGVRPIIIPAEPGDVLSHSDGTLRFWSESEILVSDFLNVPGLKGAHRRRVERYAKTLVAILATAGFDERHVKRVPCGPYAEHAGLDDIPSARGCYINYLRTRDLILVPRFGDKKQDRKALDFFHSIRPPGVKVASIDCRLLSDFGGGLNCIAATF